MKRLAMSRVRALSLLAAVVMVPLGLLLKRYRGPGQGFVNNFGPASVVYEWLWMSLAFAVLPNRRYIRRIAWCVLFITCILEVLQLWHPPLLEAARRTLCGRLILGTTFSWWDFPAYAVGCGTGVYLLRWIASSAERNSAPRQ